MDRDANYFAVGAFVLLVIAMGVSFVFWYTDQRDKHSYDRYEIYFPGSVSGLTAGSPVRYLGVDVGKVVRILIDPQQRNRVEVIADIDSTAPIDGRTQASLSLQGITGLLFIDLEQDRKTGAPVIAEVMIPVTFGRPEVDMVKAIIVATAEAVAKETGVKVPYTVGTMIELPRAALQAGEIAKTAEFFSFGTNDLTQTTLGVSRDDAASFLGIYVQKGLLPTDPFVSIDTVGVGEMIKIAVERGRAERPGMKMGICGEHGGDPASISFCESVKLDYVSCSPFRVPIARLAAAQAALGQSGANRTA